MQHTHTNSTRMAHMLLPCYSACSPTNCAFTSKPARSTQSPTAQPALPACAADAPVPHGVHQHQRAIRDPHPQPGADVHVHAVTDVLLLAEPERCQVRGIGVSQGGAAGHSSAMIAALGAARGGLRMRVGCAHVMRLKVRRCPGEVTSQGTLRQHVLVSLQVGRLLALATGACCDALCIALTSPLPLKRSFRYPFQVQLRLCGFAEHRQPVPGVQQHPKRRRLQPRNAGHQHLEQPAGIAEPRVRPARDVQLVRVWRVVQLLLVGRPKHDRWQLQVSACNSVLTRALAA